MAIRPPSLRAIAAFEAAARLGSFAKAAEELNLSQSAVSHAVRTLEERLGEILFDRSRSAVVLTQAGATLASRVRLSLSLLNEAFETISEPQRMRLVVSTLGSVAEKLVIPRLPAFFALYPDIEIELHASRRLADLKNHEADVAVRFGQGQWPGLTAVELAKDKVFPVASPHYLAKVMGDSKDDLSTCQTIVHPAISWRLWHHAAGLPNEIQGGQLITDDALLMIKAAIAGCGVALVNETLVRDDIAAGRLVRILQTEIEDDYSHWVVWDSTSAKVHLIKPFVDWLVAEFATLSEAT
jgi:LysR family glycine cleavage system transcriptional activator